jgi:hypothetical protein
MNDGLPQGKKSDPDPVNPDRRKALKTVGQFAVYVSPAMTVLLPGKADAHHNPVHTAKQCEKKPWLSFC